MRDSVSIGAALLLALLCDATRAANPHPCATVRDDTERLACYDRTFGTPAEPKQLPDPPPDPQPAKPAREAPGKFTAVVSKIEWRNGMFVATLDNGQVWSQSERHSRIQIDTDDTVTIRPASLGSFLLSTEQGIATRVRRVR